MDHSIPVFMYHKVGSPVVTATDTFLNVSARSFARQMRLLARLGYTGVTFETAVRGLTEGKTLPRKPACITFDDGYMSVADNAAPVLDEHGWPATVFVSTAFVGGANTWDEGTKNPILPLMGRDRLCALQEKGWELGGHTRTHARLEKLNDPQALAEIVEGRAEMDAAFGRPSATFCYPYGSIGERTSRLVCGAGYIGAVTCRSGIARTGQNPFLLPRVKIAYHDDAWGLLYRLYIRPHLG